MKQYTDIEKKAMVLKTAELVFAALGIRIDTIPTERVSQKLEKIVSIGKHNEFIEFCEANENDEKYKFKTGYQKLNILYRLFIDKHDKDRKEKIIQTYSSKIDLLLNGVLGLKPNMKTRIDQSIAEKYKSLTFLSTEFDSRRAYNMACSVVADWYKRTTGKNDFSNLMEKKTFIEMVEVDAFQDELNLRFDEHVKSIEGRIEKLSEYMGTASVDGIAKAKKELEEIEEAREELSLLEVRVEDCFDQLYANHDELLDFKCYSSAKVNGEYPFTDKAINTLNKIGFERVYNMTRDELRAELEYQTKLMVHETKGSISYDGKKAIPLNSIVKKMD